MSDENTLGRAWTASTLLVFGCVLLAAGCGGSAAGGGSDGGSGSTFQGTWTGSEEYVQGTFANPTAIESLGFTSLTIDAKGNIVGQTFDAVTGSTYNLTGTMAASSATAATGSITGLPGPFNTASSPNLTVSGNFKIAGASLTVSLGNSFGECTMALQVTASTLDQYAGTFTGTVTSSSGGSGTVSSFAVDSSGNVSGSYVIGGVTSAITGSITTQDVATITATPQAGGSPSQLTGAAALTGTNGGMTLFLTQSGSSTTETVNLVPSH